MDAPATGEVFAEFIDWRAEHPSDDIMTDLLNAEFEDETGTVRKLRRDELLLYLTVIATAGSETTTRLIGWAGKTLAEYPEQRRDLVANPGLIPRRSRRSCGGSHRPCRSPATSPATWSTTGRPCPRGRRC